MFKDNRIYSFADSEFPAYRLLQDQVNQALKDPAKIDLDSIENSVAQAIALGHSALNSLSHIDLHAETKK